METFKNAPKCLDLIQIIVRELISSLLKLLVLKFVKNVKVNVVIRQHNCKFIVMLPHHCIDFYIFNKF